MKNGKKLLSAALASVMVLALAGCGSGDKKAEADTASDTKTEYDNSYCVDGKPSAKLTELRESGTLTVGSSGDAPFAYIDQDTNEFKGVDAEIIKEVGKRLGIKNVEMKLVPFSELILNMNSDNIDIICDCMYIREDRAKQVYFGDIWYTQGGGLLVADDGKISGEEDFDPDSTVIGYTPGTVWQTAVEKYASDGKIKEARATGDQSESIVALQNGKIDGFLTDSTVVENLFANSPDTVKGLKMAENYKDAPESIGRIAPSVSFENIGFMKEVNNVVKDLRDEGFIDQVFTDYKLDPTLHAITNDEAKHDINTREE